MKCLSRIAIAILVLLIVILSSSCKEKKKNFVSLEYDPDSVATMITTSVSTLISDSGITRYKLVADQWLVFDRAAEPYWYFPEGFYLERFTPDFETEATVKADTAWRYTTKDLWRLKKNVHVENMKGEQFYSDELFWDQKNDKVYSEAYIEIKSGHTELKGYGFESNMAMTDYRVFRPHDGRIPFSETAPSDSLQGDALRQDSLSLEGDGVSLKDNVNKLPNNKSEHSDSATNTKIKESNERR